MSKREGWLWSVNVLAVIFLPVSVKSVVEAVEAVVVLSGDEGENWCDACICFDFACEFGV